MTCEEARQLWHDQCDGLIAPVRQAALAGHLQTCAACRAYSRQMTAIVGGLDTLRAETECVTATTDDASSQTPAPATRTRTIRWRRWSSVAAAVVLLVGAGWYLLHQHPTQSNLTTGGTVIGPLTTTIGEPGTPVSYASVTFAGNSTTSFLPVRQETSQPNVHLFRLFPIVRGEDDEINGS